MEGRPATPTGGLTQPTSRSLLMRAAAGTEMESRNVGQSHDGVRSSLRASFYGLWKEERTKDLTLRSVASRGNFFRPSIAQKRAPRSSPIARNVVEIAAYDGGIGDFSTSS